MSIDNRVRGQGGKYTQKFATPLNKKALTIRINPKSEAQIKAIAESLGLNWRDLVREAIDEYLEKITGELSTIAHDDHDLME